MHTARNAVFVYDDAGKAATANVPPTVIDCADPFVVSGLAVTAAIVKFMLLPPLFNTPLLTVTLTV